MTMLTKSNQVKQIIEEQIRRQELQPGDKLLSHRELMRKYRVSHFTISKVIDELSNSGLVERRWGKGVYVKDCSPVTRNIAVTFSDTYSITHPFMGLVLNGIDESATDSNCHLQLFPVSGVNLFGSGNSNLLYNLLLERRIDGLIGCSAHPPEDVWQILRMGVPMVSILHEYPGLNVGSVLPDAVDAARQMIGYLAKLGHRKIKLVWGPSHNFSARLIRFSSLLSEALLQEIRACGLSCPENSILNSDYRFTSIESQVRDWLTGEDRPTALVFNDDILAVQTIRLAQELGLSVPKNLSVISFGDILTDPELTTVSVPLKTIGRKAVEMLQAMRSGEPAHPKYLPVKLAIRKTCCPVSEMADR